METSLEGKLHRAAEKVKACLNCHGIELPPSGILVDPEVEEATMATHRHPGMVVVREASVSESIIAHELVHIAQRTLEQFRGFQLLYVLLSEGLADWIAREVYPQHEVKYRIGCRLVELLVRVDEKSVHDLFRLNDLALTTTDVDNILGHPRLPGYSRHLLNGMADRIRESIHTARENSIADPTFITLGEEIRAWKFLLSERFEAVDAEVGKLLRQYFSKTA